MTTFAANKFTMKKIIIIGFCLFSFHGLNAQVMKGIGVVKGKLDAKEQKEQEQQRKDQEEKDRIYKEEQKKIKEQEKIDQEKKDKENKEQAAIARKKEIIETFPQILDSTSGYYVKSDPFDTPFHKQNVGKIYFSAGKTVATAVTAKSFTDTIIFGQEIDLRFFLATSICNYKVYDKKKDVFYMNEKPDANNRPDICEYSVVLIIGKDTITITDDNGQQKSYSGFRYPIYSRTEGNKYNNDFYVDKLNKIPVGTHRFEAQLWAGRINESYANSSYLPIATGEIVLVKKDMKPLKLGSKFSDIKSVRKDPALEASALKALNDHFSSQGWSTKFSAVKIHQDWTINRSYSGIILSRTLAVYANGKKDGKCEAELFYLEQAYDGANYSKVFSYAGVGMGTEIPIDCE